ncbi:uncharacterized protein FFB20_09127 [Fusarium fujikuroi]|nr:hypothetical protein CEK27_003677 [Fusarium fujikuroi]QGI88680.1 hypothetical protein CEK25_003636 [Fusarium fujikuroi]QGJ02241.1 hypothetical protein CEK26_003685 [Fusarium fujikuroi]SCN92037.1 uncharacterized protein FFB20_09127 [Fusarium fujikuroi]
MRAEDVVDDGALCVAGGESNYVIAVIDGEDSFVSVAPGADLCCYQAIVKEEFAATIFDPIVYFGLEVLKTLDGPAFITADLCCCCAVMKEQFGQSIYRMNCEHLSPKCRVECMKHCEEVAGIGRAFC